MDEFSEDYAPPEDDRDPLSYEQPPYQSRTVPNKGQFKKGESGNKRGRPKGSKNKPKLERSADIRDVYKDAEEKRHRVTIGGKVRRRTAAQIGAMTLASKFAAGELPAMREVLRAFEREDKARHSQMLARRTGVLVLQPGKKRSAAPARPKPRRPQAALKEFQPLLDELMTKVEANGQRTTRLARGMKHLTIKAALGSAQHRRMRDALERYVQADIERTKEMKKLNPGVMAIVRRHSRKPGETEREYYERVRAGAKIPIDPLEGIPGVSDEVRAKLNERAATRKPNDEG